MKVWVTKDEWYPFWMIDEVPVVDMPSYTEIEMSETEINEYNMAVAVLSNLFKDIYKRVSETVNKQSGYK